jgi:hypothetical protein
MPRESDARPQGLVSPGYRVSARSHARQGVTENNLKPECIDHAIVDSRQAIGL